MCLSYAVLDVPSGVWRTLCPLWKHNKAILVDRRSKRVTQLSSPKSISIGTKESSLYEAIFEDRTVLPKVFSAEVGFDGKGMRCRRIIGNKVVLDRSFGLWSRKHYEPGKEATIVILHLSIACDFISRVQHDTEKRSWLMVSARFLAFLDASFLDMALGYWRQSSFCFNYHREPILIVILYLAVK